MKNRSFLGRVAVFALAAISWAITPATTLPTFAMAKQVAGDAVDSLKSFGVALFTSYAVRVAPYAQAFQSVIRANMALGVIGEFFLDAGGSGRVFPGVVKGTAANIVIGRWFTKDAADGLMQPGGTGAIGGLLMSPKEYSTPGTAAGGALAPSLTLLAGTVGSFCTDTPGIIVELATAVAEGDVAKYNTTTGVIGVGAPGAGEAAIPNAKFVRYANLAAGLAVLSLIGN